MDKAVAYYRVSTQKQGQSGLGLEAQKAAVHSYATGRYELIAEFTEVESGKKTNRQQLAEAMGVCRATGATLLIAKLDRLARNVAFTSAIMESGIKFTAVDMPDANNLTIHVIAAIAQHERELISKRTKDALTAAKVRGQELGNLDNLTDTGRAMGRAVVQQKAVDNYALVTGYIVTLRDMGLTLRKIAGRLNVEGHKTAKGKEFTATTIKRILDRLGDE
jgi:DNA invertase Pin-like site-specific DNA recombinase